MKSKLNSTRRLFTLTVVGFAVGTVMIVGLVLYATSVIGYHNTVSADKLATLTLDYPAVAAYLNEQKNAEAHFVTLSNLVKNDQQRLLGKALVIALVPTLLTGAAVGYFVARRLLKPVQETFENQERFLQDAAHEMRNPLAAMRAVIQRALQAPQKSSHTKALATLDRQTSALIKLNEDLLFLERSREKRQYKNINAAELLLDVIESLQQNAVGAQVKIISKISKPVSLVMQEDDFVCLARNILENAIKYSHPNESQKIVVSLQAGANQTTLSIKDTGIGIPSDELAHIGQRFYRARNVGKTAGTGLGMAIIESLTHKYHGKLSIKSTVGKGTTITISFPKLGRKIIS